MPELKDQNFQNIETLQSNFSSKLNEVLGMQLTPETIDTFYSDAFAKLISLINSIKEAYLDQNAEADLQGQELEDEAFKLFDLQNLEEVLTQLGEIEQKIEEIRNLREASTVMVDKVILPPGSMEAIEKGNGESSFDKALFNRTEMLLYILIQNFGVKPDSIIVGQILPNQVRQTSYSAIEIKSLNRIVLVCDEEDNATYIFDSEILRIKGLNIEELIDYKKEDLQDLIASYPSIGVKIAYNKITWKEKIINAMNTIEVNLSSKNEATPGFTPIKKTGGELDTRKPYYLYESEDQKLWGGTNSISREIGKDIEFVQGLIEKKLKDVMQSKVITSAGGHQITIYPLEIFLDYMLTIADIPRPNKGGEWSNFIEVEQFSRDDKYFGTIQAILTKLRSVGYTLTQNLIENIVKDKNVPVSKVLTNKGIRPAYQFVVILEEVNSHLNKPKLENNGKVTINGIVYSTQLTIAKELDVAFATLASRLAKSSIEPIEGLDSIGKEAKLYPLEETKTFFLSN